MKEKPKNWSAYCVVCLTIFEFPNCLFEEALEGFETHCAGPVHKAGGYLPPEVEDDLSIDSDDPIRKDWLRGPPPPNYTEPSDHPVFDFT